MPILIITAGTLARAAAGTSGTFVAHEWGTFTSLVDSEGNRLEGIHHEEEPLPGFVYSRYRDAMATGRFKSSRGWGECEGKGCDFVPRAGTATSVTQKMETPVIYFHSDRARDVQVDVGFPGGLITQWFPQASGYSPRAGEVTALANGSTQWNVQVLPPMASTPQPPEVDAESVWAPSRQVNANLVQVGSEAERFIFYRGLGQFKTDLAVRDRGEQLEIANDSHQNVPDVFVLNLDHRGGWISRVGAVGAGSRVRTPVINRTARPLAEYLEEASREVHAALVRSGLYSDEAWAMVNTWKTSYFRSAGLRVLYVLPRLWTNSLLPLSIRPEPQSLVRTLVGRVEVMTAGEEQELLTQFRQRHQHGPSVEALVQSLGRFAEPKLRRLSQLAGQDSATRNRIEQALSQVAAQ